jgi:hypothetical protein
VTAAGLAADGGIDAYKQIKKNDKKDNTTDKK